MNKENEQNKTGQDSEIQIQEKNIFFDSLTNNISSGIVIIKNGLISYSNAAMFKLSGYKSDELYQKNYNILFSEEEYKKVQRFINELPIRGTVKIEVSLNNTETGRVICVLDAVMVDQTNESLGIICTFSDITDRKKTEDRLKKSEEFHSVLLDAISESLIGVDSKQRIVLFNTAAKILFKRASIECIGQSPEILFSGIHKSIIKRYISNYIDSDYSPSYNPGVIEVEGITASGESIPIEISVSPANFRGENLVLLSIRDTTRRRRYESALKQKQQEQEALLDNIPDLVYFKNSGFDYVSANKAFCKFVGIDEKEIAGKNDLDLFPETVAQKHLQEDMEVVDLKKSRSSEGELFSKDNQSVYTINTRTPIFDDENNVIGLVGISRDITERREREMKLQKFTKELEETKKDLERKTYELIKVNQDLLLSRGELEKYSSQLAEQNTVLRESEIRLKNLNLQKDKFVSIISHDLRNPFTSILGHAELIQYTWKDITDEKKISYINAISSAAQHQLNQLNNLVEWARFADGRMPFRPRLLFFREIVKKSTEAFAGIRQKKSINMVTNIDDSIKILGDKNLLFRLFENLIGNAIKFTPVNGTITINTNYISESDQVYISIKDSGIGIPPEILPNLFKLEGKVSRTGTGGEPGTGLGLILCQEIIDFHHGTITVESKEGDGSVFTMNLTVASNDVLIISKDDNLCQDIRYSLETSNKNYRPVIVQSVSEIENYIKDKHPSFLVMDSSCPEQFGLLEDKLKKNSRMNLIPIIIVKEEDDDMDKKIPDYNIVQKFLKPIDRENLAYILSKILL
jgi:PAS domain S-box-containing protein